MAIQIISLPPALTGGKSSVQVAVDPHSLFRLLQQTWNLYEIVRLLDPKTKADCCFTPSIDTEWIKETQEGFADLFKDMGLDRRLMRRIFAPDNCPDLVVPHVAFETEPNVQFRPKKTGSIKRRPRKPAVIKMVNGDNDPYVNFKVAYCSVCSGIYHISDAKNRSVAFSRWPKIFKAKGIAFDSGCSC